jgi:hypothetical protein
MNATTAFVIRVEIHSVSNSYGLHSEQIAAGRRIRYVACQPKWHRKLADKASVTFEVKNLIRESAAPTFAFINEKDVIARDDHLLSSINCIRVESASSVHHAAKRIGSGP